MLRKQRLINLCLIAILLAGVLSLWRLVRSDAIPISTAVLIAAVAAVSFAVAFAVKHPQFGKALLAATAAAWTVCARVVSVLEMDWLTEPLNRFLAPLHMSLDEQSGLFLLFFLFFCLFLAALHLPAIFTDTTAMGIHSEDGDPEFRKKVSRSKTGNSARCCASALTR